MLEDERAQAFREGVPRGVGVNRARARRARAAKSPPWGRAAKRRAKDLPLGLAQVARGARVADGVGVAAMELVVAQGVDGALGDDDLAIIGQREALPRGLGASGGEPRDAAVLDLEARELAALVAVGEEDVALVEEKRAARALKGRDRLRAEVPEIEPLFERWVDVGHNLGSMVARVIVLLDAYGATALREVLTEMVTRGTHDPGAMAILCEQRRRARGDRTPRVVAFGDHVRERDVVPHDLGGYDE